MRVTFEITQDDIRLGKRKECVGCPTHRAIARKLKKQYRGQNLQVGPESIEILDIKSNDWCYVCKNYHDTESRIVKFNLPKKVIEFIKTFDENGRKAVQPMTFTLNIPKVYLE